MSEQAESRQNRGRATRGAFPRMPLKTVEKLARIVHDVGHGERARLQTVLSRINRKETSSTTSTLLTSASRGYGLVIGSVTDTHLSLTERGNALANATTDYDRHAAAFEALQQNELFRAFVDKYKHRPMPSDEVAIDFTKDSFDLSEKDAAAAVKVIKENLTDYDLVEIVGDRRVVIPPDEVLEALRSSDVVDAGPDEQNAPEPREQQSARATTPTKPPAVETISEFIPQIAFNIQIQLPSDASPETYETIFKNIAVHLLRRNPD